jgi:hypothetical protein
MDRGTDGRWALLLLSACLLAPSLLLAQPRDPLVQYIFPDEKATTALTGWRARWGDSLAWAEPDCDESQWDVVGGVGLWVSERSEGKGLRWYRKRIFIPEPLDPLKPLALYQQAVVAASEVYWDGELIARNGVVGSSAEEEVAGLSGAVLIVPGELTGQGEHVIAQRVSNYNAFSGVVEAPLLIGYFRLLQRKLSIEGAVLLFLAGVFVFTAIFHIAVLFGFRERWPYGLFSAFCIACAVHILIYTMLRYFQMDLANYYVFATINDIPWFFMMALLPVFFLFEYSFPHKKKVGAAVAAIAAVVVVMPRLVTSGLLPVRWLESMIEANRMHSYFTILLSVAVSVWAKVRGRVGSLTSTIGLVVFFLGVYITYQLGLHYGWALGFAVLIVFLTVSLSRQMAQRDRDYHQAQLHAARLELDLLKKHIQPHFLLNSLNSIIAWLEEDPSTAATLVQALAEELRLLLKSTTEKSVPLSEEVSLCRAHLRVMGLRYGKNYELRQEGGMDSLTVPPLAIHTLVENGLTHGYRDRDSGTFVLRAERTAEGTKLVLFNDGAVREADGGRKVGTGLRYVQSRLEELYPSRWVLASGPVDGGWEVTIDIRS